LSNRKKFFIYARSPEGHDKALSYLREGDTLVVWKLDRLGRSIQHLIQTVNMILPSFCRHLAKDVKSNSEVKNESKINIYRTKIDQVA